MAQIPCSSLLIGYRVLRGRKQKAQPTNTIAPLIESQPPAQSLVDGPGRWLSEGTHKQMSCAVSIRQAGIFRVQGPSPAPHHPQPPFFSFLSSVILLFLLLPWSSSFPSCHWSSCCFPCCCLLHASSVFYVDRYIGRHPSPLNKHGNSPISRVQCLLHSMLTSQLAPEPGGWIRSAH